MTEKIGINDFPILDATCGSRMIWFDKNNPNCLYVDRREMHEEKNGNQPKTIPFALAQ